MGAVTLTGEMAANKHDEYEGDVAVAGPQLISVVLSLG